MHDTDIAAERQRAASRVDPDTGAANLANALARTPQFTGAESATAWLIDTRRARELLGEPRIAMATMVDWCTDWLRRDLPSLDKPTHFEARDGRY